MKLASMFFAVFALFASAASAHDYKLGPLEISHPWSRATPAGAKVASGYMTIVNKGTAADRLKSISFELAPRVEIHEMAMRDGVMQMREVRGGLRIRPGQTVELKPGGYHVMFMDLRRPLKQGERIKGTLVFERAGKVEVEFFVEPLGTQKPAAGHGH